MVAPILIMDGVEPLRNSATPRETLAAQDAE